MAEKEPVAELEPRFSSDDATRDAVGGGARGCDGPGTRISTPRSTFRGLPLQPGTNPTVAGSVNL